MDNRLKRFLSLALAIVMVIGMMPANIVFATEEGGNTPNSGENIVTEGNGGDTSEQGTTGPTEQDPAQVPALLSDGEGGCTIPNCRFTVGHEGACEEKCDKKDDCALEKGHAYECENEDGVMLVDKTHVLSAAGLKAALGMGGTIELAANIVLTESITIGGTVNLNLKEYSISVAAPEGVENAVAPDYALINEGMLTVSGNGTIAGIHNKAAAAGILNENGTVNKGLSITGGTVEAAKSTTYAIWNEGHTIISGGTLSTTGEYAVSNYSSAHMRIAGATTHGVTNAGTLTIAGGTIYGNSGANAVLSNGGVLTISAGAIHKENVGTPVATVKAMGGCVANISGGTFSTAVNYPVLEVDTTNTDTGYGLTISGGKVIGGIKVGDTARVTVKGGTFEDVDNSEFPASASTAITVTGGTFVHAKAQAFAQKYAQPGKIIQFTQNGENVDKVHSGANEVKDVVATIGSGESLVGYYDLAMAIAAGGTIELKKDVVVNETIQVIKNVTLNMNSKTIYSNVTEKRIFKLTTDGVTTCTQFTLNGGTFENYSYDDGTVNDGGYGVVDIASAAAVNATNCTFNMDTDGGAIFRGRRTGSTYGSIKLENVKVDTSHYVYDNGGAEYGAVTSFEVVGGNIKSDNAAFAINVINTVTFTDATIEAGTMAVEVSGVGSEKATATFTGNKITILGTGEVNGGMENFVLGVSDGINTTIVSGTYGSSTYAGDLIGLTTSGENLVIQGGTFHGRICSMNAAGKVEITGGTFNSFTVNTSNGGAIEISGGRFQGDPTTYLKTHYKAVEDEEQAGWYDVLRKVVDGKKPATLKVNGTITNTISDEIVNAILACVEANATAAKNVPEGMTLVITPKEITVDNNVKISKIVYDVTPDPEYKGTAAITFRLPIPKAYVNDFVAKANVYHGTEKILNEIEIVKEQNKDWYIEVSSATFSPFTVELIDIDFTEHVARIGNKGYETVQEAVGAAVTGDVVYLMPLVNNNTYQNVSIDLSTFGKSITIDGAEATTDPSAGAVRAVWQFDTNDTATIAITGGSDSAAVTIKNIAFTRSSKTSGAFIQIAGNGQKTNVLIEDCTFTGPGSDKAMVGISLTNTNGVKIQGSTATTRVQATGLQSFVKNVGGKNLTVKNTTITSAAVGLELGTIVGVNLVGVTVDGTFGKYGVSMDASVNNNAVFDGCTIGASLPIMVHGAEVNGENGTKKWTTTHGKIEFKGSNQMNGGVTIVDDDGTRTYWMILANEKYTENLHDTNPKNLRTDGRIVITMADTGLSGEGINYKHKDTKVTPNKYYTVAPEGRLDSAVVFDNTGSGNSHISLDIEGLVASERVIVEIYNKQGYKIADTKLVDQQNGYLYFKALTGVLTIANKDFSKSWQTSWVADDVNQETVPTYKTVPHTAKLYIDGAHKGTVNVIMENIPTEKHLWTDVEGVGNLTLTTGGKTTWKHTLADAFTAVDTESRGTVNLYNDNTAILSAAGEITGGKTVTITTVDRMGDKTIPVTLDWGNSTDEYLFVGRGSNAGNGTLIFDDARIAAAGDKPGGIGIHVSGARAGRNNVCNGTLVIQGDSDIVLDYLVNRNNVTITGEGNKAGEKTKLTIRNGFASGGRPATEAASGQTAVATMTVEDGAMLHIDAGKSAAQHEGLGYEGYGILNVNSATFKYVGDFYIEREEGTDVNVFGTSTLEIGTIFSGTAKCDNVDVTFGKAINVRNGATVVDSTVGGDAQIIGTATNKISAAFIGTNKFKNIAISFGTLNTNTESKIIVVESIVQESDEDKIIIDATDLDKEEGVKVIDLNGHANSVAAMKSNKVTVKDNKAAKRVADDGDVTIYFEAYIDENGDKKLNRGEGFATIEGAVAAAAAGKTVILLADAYVEAPVGISKNIVLELNKKTIHNGSTGISILKVTASDAIVQNGNIDAFEYRNTGIEVEAAAGVELIGVNIKGNLAGIKTSGNVTVGTGTVVAARWSQESIPAIIADENAVVTINGGTVGDATTGCAIELNDAASATINGGEVIGAPAVSVYGGTLTINGGMVSRKDTTANAIITHSIRGDEPVSDTISVVINGGQISGPIIAKDNTIVHDDYRVSVIIKGGNFTNSYLDWDYYNNDEYARIAVSRAKADVPTIFDAFVPFEMIAPDFTCQKVKDSNPVKYEIVPYEHVRIYMYAVDDYVDDGDENTPIQKIVEGDDAHVDGNPYEVQPGKVLLISKDLAKKTEMFITTYGVNNNQTPDDDTDDYPTAMYVWYAMGTDANKDGICDSYSVERVKELDGFFQYHGTSIRVGGSSNGIRFFSSVNANDANKLMSGTLITDADSALYGAKMVSAGTWFKKTNEARSEVYGGKVGKNFRVFQKYAGRNWFTGVLVGLDKKAENVAVPFQTRPFADIDVDGKTVTLYGGLLKRSIYYVATQNKDVFNGTSYDSFVENLIKMGYDYLHPTTPTTPTTPETPAGGNGNG